MFKETIFEIFRTYRGINLSSETLETLERKYYKNKNDLIKVLGPEGRLAYPLSDEDYEIQCAEINVLIENNVYYLVKKPLQFTADEIKNNRTIKKRVISGRYNEVHTIPKDMKLTRAVTKYFKDVNKINGRYIDKIITQIDNILKNKHLIISVHPEDILLSGTSNFVGIDTCHNFAIDRYNRSYFYLFDKYTTICYIPNKNEKKRYKALGRKLVYVDLRAPKNIRISKGYGNKIDNTIIRKAYEKIFEIKTDFVAPLRFGPITSRGPYIDKQYINIYGEENPYKTKYRTIYIGYAPCIRCARKRPIAKAFMCKDCDSKQYQNMPELGRGNLQCQLT